MKSERERKNYKKRIAPSSHTGMASGVAKYRHSYRLSKRVIAFVLALAMVLGLVYVDGRRKKARADGGETISFDDGTWAEYSNDSSIYEDGYLTKFIDNWSTDAVTVVTPSKKLIFNADKMAIPNDTGNEYTCVVWTKDELDSEWSPYIDPDATEVNSSTIDYRVEEALQYSNLDLSDGSDSKNCYLYRFYIIKDEGDKWVVDSSRIEHREITLKYEEPQAPVIQKNNFVYSISDKTDGENVYYYDRVYYGIEEFSGDSISGFDSNIDANLSKTAVAEALGAEGNDEDKTYIITKKVVGNSNTDIIYGWQGIYTRDDDIDIAEDFSVTYGTTAVSGKVDPSKAIFTRIKSNERTEGYITISDSEGLFPKRGGDDTDALPNKEKWTPTDTDNAFNDQLTNEDYTADLSGKSTTVSVLYEVEGKRPYKKDIAITFEDVTPKITLSTGGVDTSTATEIDGKYYIGGEAIVWLDLTAGETGTSARISSSGIKATSDNEGFSFSVPDSFSDLENKTGVKLLVNPGTAGDGDSIVTVNIENDRGISASTPLKLGFGIDKTGPVIDGAKLDVSCNNGAVDISKKAPVHSGDIIFKVPIADALVGVDDSEVEMTASVGGTVSETITGNYVDDNWEFVQSSPSTYAGKTVQYSVTAKDKLGNVAEPYDFSVSYSLGTLSVDEGFIAKVDKTEIEKDPSDYTLPVDGIDITEEGIEILAGFKVTSDVPIKEPQDEWAKVTSVTDDVTATYDAADSTINEVDSTGNYVSTVYYKVVIPQSTTINGISFTPVNEFGDSTTPYNMGIINIDINNPSVGIEAYAGTETVEGRTAPDGHLWYRQLAVLISYEDGTYTSGIQTATIEGITDKPDGTGNSFDFSTYNPGTAVYYVNPSNTLEGTKVGWSITDKAGNSDSGDKTFYVDSTKPTLDSFDDADGDISSGDYTNDSDQTLVATVNNADGKLYRDVIFTAEYKGFKELDYSSFGTAVKKIISDDEFTAGVTLNELAGGQEIKDGRYRIKASVADYAMEEDAADADAKYFELVIDSAAPEIKKVKMTQRLSPDDKVFESADIETGDVVFDEYYPTRKAEIFYTLTDVYDPTLDLTEGLGSISIVRENSKGEKYNLVKDTDYQYERYAGILFFDIHATLDESYIGEQTYTITLKDAAGNGTIRKVTATYLEDVIDVTHSVDTSFDQPDSEKSEYQGNISPVNITFNIKSDAEVSRDGLELKKDGTSVDISTTGEFKVISDELGKYEYEFIYPLEGVDQEIKLDFKAANVFGVNDSEEISAVRFDLNDPDLSDAVDTTSVAGDGHGEGAGWYKNLVLLVTYDDTKGSDPSVKWFSGIKELTISNISKGTDNPQEWINNYIAAHPDTGSFAVEVNQSPDINGTEVNFSIKDYVGNSKAYVKTYKVDRTEPEIEMNITPEKADGDYYKGNPTISIKGNEDVSVREYAISVNCPNGSDKKKETVLTVDDLPEKALTDSVTIGDILGAAPADGKYTVSFNAKNMPGTDGTPVQKTTFYIDNTEPEIDKFKVEQPDTPAFTGNGKEDLDAFQYASTNNDLKISFGIDDNLVGLQSAELVNDKNDVTKSWTSGNTIDWVFSGTDMDGFSGETVTFTLTAKDKLDNTFTKTFTVEFIVDEVKVTHGLVKEETENGTEKIVYTITSQAEVKVADVVVTQVNKQTDAEKATGSGAFTDSDYDSATNTYTYTYTYTLTALNSDIVSEINCKVTNVNGVVGNAEEINYVKFDLIDPEVTADDWYDDTTWYPELQIVLNANDGTREFVSGVKEVTISGFVQSELDPSGKYTCKADNLPLTAAVSPSDSLNGTPVEITVVDNIGRSKTYNGKYKVDGENPEVELNFKLNGESKTRTAAEVNGKYIKGDPIIGYHLKDNLKLKEYSLTIVDPNGASHTIVSGNDETGEIDVSDDLSNMVGGAIEGEYTITLHALDIADRHGDAADDAGDIITTFTIDNSRPLNDLVVTQKAPAFIGEYFNHYVFDDVSYDVEYDYGQYYSDLVSMKAWVNDDNIDTVTVTDNGKKVDAVTSKSGEQPFNITGEGEHVVKITSKDMSGNEANTMEVSFYIDKTTPTTSLKVNNKDAASVDKKYIKGDPTIGYDVVENKELHEGIFTIKDPEGASHEVWSTDKGTGTSGHPVEGKLSGLAGKKDGTYVLSLNAKDRSGRAPKTVKTSIILDNTAPAVNSFGISQAGNDGVITKKETAEGATFRGVTGLDSSSSKGVFTISFKAEDPKAETDGTKSGIKEITVTEKVNGNEKVVYNSSSEGSQSFKIDANDTYTGKTAAYEIVAVDSVGNEIKKVVTVVFAKEAINVTHGGYKESTTSGVFDIVYNIKSDVPISVNESSGDVLDDANVSLEMVTVDGAKNKKTAGKGVLKKASSYNPATFSYNYTYTYTINKTMSDKLQNINVAAKNNNGKKSNTDTISLINIDLTDPVISPDVLDQNRWYQALTITLGYNDGNREFMSGVKSIKITGVKEGDGEYITAEQNTVDVEKDSRIISGNVVVNVNESANLDGTKVTLAIVDNLGRNTNSSYTFKVDEHNPITALSVNGRSASDINGAYIGNAVNKMDPAVAFTANDNIQIQNYRLVITVPSGKDVEVAKGSNTNNVNISTTLGALIGSENLNGGVPRDGVYTLKLYANDPSGRVADGTNDEGALVTQFTLDNSAPRNDLQILNEAPPKFDKYQNTYSNEATGRNYKYGQYYNKSVAIDAIVDDNNVRSVVISDNGSVIYTGETAGTVRLDFSAEGEHRVVINTVDKTGLTSQEAAVSFIIDTTNPTLSTSLNNIGFSEGEAVRYLKSEGDVGISVSDTNIDEDDLTMTVQTTPPNQGTSTSSSKIAQGSQHFSQDADYVVKFVAIDRAGNTSEERTVSFRVDKTPPELRFSGAVENGTSRSNVNMSYIVNEAFYSDMVGCTLKVYKKVDGSGESLLRTVDIKPTGPNYTMNELFEDDGEYRFEMTAEDKCGNQANANYTFILDGKAPIITLNGVMNYDKTDDDVTMGITVDEVFFSSNKVVLSGTRQDIDGVKHKIDFNAFNVNGSKVSNFEQIFKEDGIYDITVTSTDRAGNSTTKQVHFTIDRTAPVINEIDKYADKNLSSFKWDIDSNKLVRDLTVCNIAIYMDGVEYDGTSDLSEGAHVLRVTATDELGHTTEKEVSFILDSGAPNILVSGVEEGQYLKVPTQITVSVQLDSDKLTKVTLNGEEIQIVDGVATFTVDTRKAYTLKAEAVDDAGNVSSLEMNFNFGERFPWWILIAIGGALLLIFLILLFSRKRDKKENK